MHCPVFAVVCAALLCGLAQANGVFAVFRVGISSDTQRSRQQWCCVLRTDCSATRLNQCPRTSPRLARLRDYSFAERFAVDICHVLLVNIIGLTSSSTDMPQFFQTTDSLSVENVFSLRDRDHTATTLPLLTRMRSTMLRTILALRCFSQ